MDSESRGGLSSPSSPAVTKWTAWEILWFLLHLAAVYALVHFATPSFAGWTKRTVLPALQYPSASGDLEFFFSHLFAFSFIPAFLTALVNIKFRNKAAQYVWLVPAVILAYKFLTFPAPSVLQSRFPAAFHEYFDRGFVIPEYRNWTEFWSIARSNPDVARGMAQESYTAPFYAGASYSLAAWLARRFARKAL